MPTVRLHMTSALSAPELMAVLTDFSPARPNVWRPPSTMTTSKFTQSVTPGQR